MRAKQTALVPTGPLSPDVVRQTFEELHERAIDFEKASASKNTKVAYERAWRRFDAWCAKHGVESLPATAETLKLYITAAANSGIPHADGTPGKPLARRSIDVQLAAIAYVHDIVNRNEENAVNPVRALSKVFTKGVRRKLKKPPRKKMHITMQQLYAAVQGISPTFKGKRDRAILLCAFAAGGRRRSEIAGMRMEDIVRTTDGTWVWTVAESKTDQEGEGFSVTIPRLKNDAVCPATALATWLKASGIESGPVFPGIDRFDQLRYREGDGGRLEGAQPRLVATLVKEAAKRLGLDARAFGGHSLRAGFMTEMAAKGMRLEDIMDRSGHRSVAVAQGYVRVGRMLSEDDPVRKVLDDEDSAPIAKAPRESGHR